MSAFFTRLRTLLMTFIATISRKASTPSPGGGGSTPQTPYLAAIVLTGDTAGIVTHTTNAYAVLSQTDQNGLPFAGSPGPFTFASANQTVATIGTTSGIATILTAGTSGITVSTLNSLGQRITSNTVTLTASAQVATTATVTPPSATLANPGTQQFAAVVYDQVTSSPNAISGATGAWDTSDHAKATISAGGLATAVAPTSGTPISVTFTSGAAVGTATVSVSATSTVQSVTVAYNSQVAPILAWAGTTYALTAADQSGNALTGAVGAWTSSDPTNCPVNSSTGVISPAATYTGATITYTHTASGHTGTLGVTVLKTPPAFIKQERVVYANDAAFRANISTNANGNGYAVPPATGGQGALYSDGVKEGRLTLDNTRLFMGNQSILMSMVVGDGPPQLFVTLGANYNRTWVVVVKRFDAGFNVSGSGVGAPAYKDGPFLSNAGQSGRTGWTYTNTALYQETLLLNAANGVAGGADETGVGNITTEWSSEQWIVDILLYEPRMGSVMSSRGWKFFAGANPISGNLITNTAVEGSMVQPATPMQVNYFSPLGSNYNLGITTNKYKSVALWGVVNGDTYGDPFGLLGTQATPTLTGITGGSLTPGDTSKTIVLTGTNFNENCYPVFSNAGIVAHYTPGNTYTSNITITATTITAIVDVTAAAATGNFTVAVYNAASQVTTATQAVTVGNLAAPNAPTLSNASAVSFNSLTIPYVLSASGGLPASLAWFYRVNGSGSAYTQGSPSVTLVSPALGGSGNAVISLPAASTTYDIKMQAVNNGGTSADSNVVTGTTAAPAAVITTNQVLRIMADAGLDVSTDGAGVGSATDQSPAALGAVLLQGTGTKQPILRTAVYNGHNAMRFTSANQSNLTSTAAISSLNTDAVTVYVVCASLADNPSGSQRFWNNYSANGGAAYEGFHVTHTGSTNTANLFAGPLISGAVAQVAFSTAMTVASGLHILTATLDHGTGTLITYYDGVLVNTVSRAYNTQTTAPTVVSLGSQNGSSSYLDGDISDFIQYNVAHTASQVAQNVAALKTTYGIS